MEPPSSLAPVVPRGGLHRPVRLDPAGETGPTRADVRAGRWERVWRGWFVPAGTDRTQPDQRVLEAAVLLPASRSAGLTGWAGLRWQGARWLDGVGRGGRLLDVDLVSTAVGVRPRPGIALSEERLTPTDVVVVDGVPVTTAARSVCFALRYHEDEREAAVLGDVAIAAGLCSVDDVVAYADTIPGWTGIPTARRRLRLLADGSASPGETRMRLIWELDAGLPRPLRNAPVFDRNGRHLATVDLLDPVVGVVGEYDGKAHLRSKQRRRDLRRENDLRAVGLEYVTMVAGDEYRRGATADRIRAAYRRARREPVAMRSWTLEQPEWWRRARAERATRRPA